MTPKTFNTSQSHSLKSGRVTLGLWPHRGDLGWHCRRSPASHGGESKGTDWVGVRPLGAPPAARGRKQCRHRTLLGSRCTLWGVETPASGVTPPLYGVGKGQTMAAGDGWAKMGLEEWREDSNRGKSGGMTDRRWHKGRMVLSVLPTTLPPSRLGILRGYGNPRIIQQCHPVAERDAGLCPRRL